MNVIRAIKIFQQNFENDLNFFLQVGNLPESLRKFFKQIQRLYERDSDFQANLDNIIENAQVILN